MKKGLLFLMMIMIIFTACAEEQEVYTPIFGDDGLVLVEGGSFMMGGGELEESQPIHEVTVSDFYLSAYEVTVAEIRAFTEDSGIPFDWDDRSITIRFDPEHSRLNLEDNWPMFNITWLEAVKYCNWLSEKRGLQPVYRILDESRDEMKVEWDRQANGYRLPTEAEWEYAARGGRWSKDTLFAGSNNIDEVAWYEGNSGDKPWELQPHEVGTKQPNELGLYDMTGNLSEWVWDYFGIDYYSKSLKDNPVGPDVGYAPEYFTGHYELNPEWETIARVVRGGGWMSSEKWATITSRTGHPWFSRPEFGFRIARNAVNDAE